MRVDDELIDRIVDRLVSRLGGSEKTRNVLVLCPRHKGSTLPIAADDSINQRLYYSDDSLEGIAIDRYILPRLELNDLVDLALGKAGSDQAEAVRNLLLSGKKVEVIEYAHTGHQASAPSALYALYCGYAETVQSFGLQPLVKTVKNSHISKRVVSEHDIEKYHNQGVARLSVDNGSLVTALAEETAKKYGIEIQRDPRGA